MNLTPDSMVVFSKFIWYGNGIIKIPSPMIRTGIALRGVSPTIHL